MRTLLLLLILVPVADAAVLFRNARVFDGDKLLPARTEVLVDGTKIVAVGRSLKAPAGTQVVDASGKTLLPGLIDAHTHAFGDALQDALIFGVTTELDQFTAASAAQAWREEQRAGNVATRADIFSAGTLVTAPGGHGTEYGLPIPTITKPEEAAAFVDARIAEGSDWIKIVYDDGRAYGMTTPTIDLLTMRAVIQAAKARGKLAVVHIGTQTAARDALEAGAHGLVHLFVDGAPNASFAPLARKSKAFVIPTLSVLQSVTGVSSGASLQKDERLLPFINATARTSLGGAFPRSARQPAVSYPAAEETVRRLIAAGVPVLAGTDAPNPGTAHGVSMHGELELLVRAGLTPAQALRAATGTPARAFGLGDRGRIAPGLRADLLLVDGDPTVNITASRAIAAVWKGGARVDREAYAKSVREMAVAKTVAPKGLDAPVLSGFDDGALQAAFGTVWMPTADDIAGGKSKGTIEVVDGGASNTSRSLRIRGEIDGSLPYAWYGAMWSPGSAPMQPADLSSKKELRFQARGDGKTYRVMVFTTSKGRMPAMATFATGPAWREVVIPWSAFGTDGRDVMAVIIAGGPQGGAFELQIDEVSLR